MTKATADAGQDSLKQSSLDEELCAAIASALASNPARQNSIDS
jgi:hypothetical protein